MISLIKRQLGNLSPFKQELVVCHAYGCMATEWEIKDRGFIKKTIVRNCYNGTEKGHATEIYIVESADGSTFESIKDRCQEGLRKMGNVEEDLRGKIVEVC